jgi:hypothetical protein
MNSSLQYAAPFVARGIGWLATPLAAAAASRDLNPSGPPAHKGYIIFRMPEKGNQFGTLD